MSWQKREEEEEPEGSGDDGSEGGPGGVEAPVAGGARVPGEAGETVLAEAEVTQAVAAEAAATPSVTRPSVMEDGREDDCGGELRLDGGQGEVGRADLDSI